MSFFGGPGRSYSDSERLRAPSHGHPSHSRGHSPARSTRSSGGGGYFVRPSHNSSSHGHARSTSSFFGNFGVGGSSSSSRGIFGGGSSASYYKRRPRDGYISYLIHKLQRMVRELWYYARRHPVKAFFAVVVPLLSAGGAIGGLLRQFNIRLPGMDSRSMYSRGGGYYGSSGYGGGGGGLMDQAGSLMQIARAFM